LGAILLGYSNLPPGDQLERVRAFTRDLEFDYVSWTIRAAAVKASQFALGASDYLPDEARRAIVLDYLELVARIQRAEAHLNQIYSDPEVTNPQIASTLVRQQLDELYAQRARLGPLSESILQSQTRTIVAELGLGVGGQPIPPILYHSTPLPTALIISPREEIRQDHNLSLAPDLAADERSVIEDQIDQDLDVSSLIVNIGGIGLYPTMIMQTSNLNFLTEVVAHEWIHNYFTLRPLGLYYLVSPELRTMNETAATIAGIEIGRLVMERYYPDRLPPPPPPEPLLPPEPDPDEPPAFDFRAEMHLTRDTVDDLLAQGRIEQAEVYMRERRVFFWEHGYRHIRKLNQAYFAFYGAYADQPGGPAGEDPVGEAVRLLRVQSPTLSGFVFRISWMTSFEQLQAVVDELYS
jgi:hypothetical protein